MHNLYEAIVAKIEAKKSLFINNELPTIEVVDLYMGQPIAPGEFEFTLPAIFIDYNIDWEQNIITIDAHLLADFMEDTENISEKRSLGLNYMRTVAIVRRILTNVSTPFITGLKPMSERPATTDYYHYHILTFRANILDYVDTELIPASNIDVDIDGVLDRHDIKPTKPVVTTSSEFEIDTYNK